MKIVSPSQMRELDRRTMAAGVPGEELMRIAGEGLADAVRNLASNHQLADSPVLFVAGPGNNGGDAFVAACSLHRDGWPVECWLACPEERIKGDALVHFRIMKKAGVPLETLVRPEDWMQAEESGTDAEIVVDGLLGTGFSGEPQGAVAAAIHYVDAQADRALVVAVDVPSAMAVRADLTVAMGLPKVDCFDADNMDCVGRLEVVDIGIPGEFVDEVESETEAELIHSSELATLFRRRNRDSHKGTYGHVLCIGGSKGFSGAIAMAARAALRSGAGLVSLQVPEAIHAVVASMVPEAMVHSARPDGRWTAILAGPGMGRGANTREQVLHLLQESKVPLVLDADAITVLSDDIEAVSSAACPVVLTPHPGEFAALFGLKPEEVQEDRLGMARMAAARLKATVVLKGAGTVVASRDRRLGINMTGNPGMATGGSGDVLAGMIAALVGQGMDTFEAACAGVWLHGHAGDLAAAEKSQASMIVSDLIEKLPEAFRAVSCR